MTASIGLATAIKRVVTAVAKSSPKRSAQIVSWQLAGSLASVGQLLAIRELVSSVNSTPPGPSLTDLVPVLTVLSVSALASTLATAMLMEMRWLLAEDLGRELRGALAGIASKAKQHHLDDPSLHDRIRIAHDTIVQRVDTFAWAVLRTGLGGLGILAIGLVLVRVTPSVLLVVALSSIPVLAVSRYKSQVLFQFFYKETPADRRRDYLEGMLFDRRALAELIAHGARPLIVECVDQMFADRVERAHKIYRRRLPAVVLGAATSVAGLAIALGSLLYLIETDSVSLADAAVAALALHQLRSRITTFTIGIEEMQQAAPFIGVIDGLRTELSDEHSPPAIEPVPWLEQLTIADVSFSYPGASVPALTEISMTLERGTVVALVGENGSGKTTLAKLVAGLYQPTAGQILWNETPLKQVLDTGLPLVAQQFQDFNRYELSVLDNITLGDPTIPADHEKAVRAAHAAGAAEWIEQLPDSYETVVSRSLSEGTELSGGQWQRLALARTIYRQGTVVVLDEPTAAQDPIREADLLRRVKAALSDSTVLLISHQLSAVRWADTIGVLNDGCLVEWGSHEELMAEGGRYQTMFNLQASRYATSNDAFHKP